MSQESTPRSDTTPARGGDIRSNTSPTKQNQGDQQRRGSFVDKSAETSRKGASSDLDDDREPEERELGDRTTQRDAPDAGPHLQPPTQSSGGKDVRSFPGTKQDQQKKPDLASGQQHKPRKEADAERDAKHQTADSKPNRNKNA
jgi:hypothetical protein